MCGLVGIAGKLTANTSKKAIAEGLVVCGIRGMDSTGIANIATDGEWKVAKTLGPAPELFNYIPFDRLSFFNQQALIGHCRAATRGQVTRQNAHPFAFDHIVGVHNGTLKGNWRNDLDEGKWFDVDSEALIYNIATNGIEETIPKIDGAWALVWWDAKLKRLCFLRNDQRPLWYAYTEGQEQILWASETWMISAMCREGRFKLAKDANDMTFYRFPTDNLVQFEINPNGKPGEIITRIKNKEIKGKAVPPAKKPSSKGGSGSDKSKGGNVVTGPFGSGAGQQASTPDRRAATNTAKSSTSLSTEVSNSGNPTGFHFHMNTTNSQQGNKRNGSGSSVPNTRSDMATRPSVRHVAGETYICAPGWTRDAVEMSWAVFQKRTGGCCRSCGSEAEHAHQVGVIMPGNSSYLCTDCVEQPTKADLMRQCIANINACANAIDTPRPVLTTIKE